ncbi:MAG: type II secretion system F family protein [Acidobacteria bacterium]|nr:type II secretion system F family protein [Acidobacteriota bacterium]
MVAFYFLALLFGFAAAFVAVQALTPSPSQVYELRQRAASRAEAQSIQSPILRLLWPLLSALLPIARKMGKPEYREQKTRDIPLAGLPRVVTVDHLLALKLLLTVSLPLIVLAEFQSVVLAVLGAGIGWILPDRMIAEQKRAREQKIVRAMPGAVDMLTLAVEAGMDFIAALQRVMDKAAAGPLREEIATIISDIRLGASRSAAMRSFSQRINVPEVVSFVGVLIQADRLGASIGEVLRNQADRMRTERFQRAEKAGAAASQKLLVPLILFIFPAVLIVIIGPVVLSFIYGGGF